MYVVLLKNTLQTNKVVTDCAPTVDVVEGLTAVPRQRSSKQKAMQPPTHPHARTHAPTPVRTRKHVLCWAGYEVVCVRAQRTRKHTTQCTQHIYEQLLNNTDSGRTVDRPPMTQTRRPHRVHSQQHAHSAAQNNTPPPTHTPILSFRATEQLSTPAAPLPACERALVLPCCWCHCWCCWWWCWSLLLLLPQQARSS